MKSPLVFGDPVVRLRGAGSDPREIGLVAELRSADCRLLFLESGHGEWAALSQLRRARPDEVGATICGTVSELLAILAAAELEFSALPDGRLRLIASHGAILGETVDQVRRLLGGRLLTFIIRPQGMHRIQSIIEFSR